MNSLALRGKREDGCINIQVERHKEKNQNGDSVWPRLNICREETKAIALLDDP